MVADFDESRMLGELNDLEEEIALVEFYIIHLDNFRSEVIFTRIFKRLQDMKYHQEMRLKTHRQKVQESGIKT